MRQSGATSSARGGWKSKKSSPSSFPRERCCATSVKCVSGTLCSGVVAILSQGQLEASQRFLVHAASCKPAKEKKLQTTNRLVNTQMHLQGARLMDFLKHLGPAFKKTPEIQLGCCSGTSTKLTYSRNLDFTTYPYSCFSKNLYSNPILRTPLAVGVHMSAGTHSQSHVQCLWIWLAKTKPYTAMKLKHAYLATCIYIYIHT